VNTLRTRKGFTIIELLIVVIVIGILAAAGLAKYQNFAETSRRKTCIGQLKTIETGLAVWETNNVAFADNSKCAFGLSPRTGSLMGTANSGALLSTGTVGTIAPIGDIASVVTVGGPSTFVNNAGNGPLGSVIRDDNVWVCPSALSRYYGGEIQNVPDDYLDTVGGGVTINGNVAHGGFSVGLGGRYQCAAANAGKVNVATPVTNSGFPAGWITGSAVATGGGNSGNPCPQVPFKIIICGAYGTFGTGAGTSNVTGTSATNTGGPVGPDGSTLNRHSSRW